MMLDLLKSKRVWAASLCASAYATIPFVLFPVYFVLIIFAIRTGRERAISYFDAPRFGAQLALRVLTAFSLVGVLRFNFQTNCINKLVGSGEDTKTIEAYLAWRKAFDIAYASCSQTDIDLNNFIRVVVFCALILIWTKLDRRSLTAVRVGVTGLVAFAALLLNGALSPRPGSVDPNWTLGIVWARLDLTTIIGTYSEITFQVLAAGVLGYLLGHLCAPCFGRPEPLPQRIGFCVVPPAGWYQGSSVHWYQLLAGAVAAVALSALFMAQNSALYDQKSGPLNMKWPVDWSYSFDEIIGRFNYDALVAGLWGAFDALPFIVGGAAIVWLLGKARLTGINPILVVGAVLGRLAGDVMGTSYETPFLSPLDSATLLGMIIAAGFGAAANLFAARRSAST
jgi:hypothetical protein